MDVERAQQLLMENAKDLRCGCDGGNFEGKLWYFGLEPGGNNPFNLEPKQNFHDENLTDEERVFWIGGNPYGRYFNQFFRAFFSLEDMTGLRSAEDSCNKFGLLAKTGPVFRGNVYPISRKSHDLWNKLDVFQEGNYLGKAPQVTGWTLEEYREKMLENRKPVLLKKLEEINSPDNNAQTIVVCTATSQRNKFAKAFGVDENSFEEISFNHSKGGSAYLAPIYGNTSNILGWLYVIPFFRTAKGSLSYKEQRAYGTKLRQLLIERQAKTSFSLKQKEKTKSVS